ncbi:hypothetical protein L207DRAFT_637438 [Hyaloscypha variabilis F]|uniref:Mid2 domain-containing protein n=1 Tax=Hyaloscypha variabilis (strain UAMH 11265 / GT02V1 / F) TaxID=1149755 RepID=A0A2J6RCS0_HYAVF|nr:hypothetical protein L207DRAFT_637438 [Hyaloscypha variabilis F]
MAVTRSNLGPLTTAWSQPSSCSMPMAISQSDEGAFADTQTVGLGLTCAASSAAACNTGTISCSTSYFSSLDPACFPPSTTSYYSAGQGFYSPGLVCPQSYTKACETTSGGTGDFQPEYALTAGETAAGCCPISFNCNNDGTTQGCIYTATSTYFIQDWCYSGISSLSAYQVPATLVLGEGGPASLIEGPQATPINTAGSGESEGIFYQPIDNVIVNAPMVQINFKASDLTLTTGATGSTTSATATNQSPTTSSTHVPASPGLSSGAKAGIGVGVAIVALVVIGLLAWFILRNRRSKSKLSTSEQSYDAPPELQGREKYEMPGQPGQYAQELPHNGDKPPDGRPALAELS